MEIKINKEILTYQETIFFGLTMRQFFCSALAVGTALGLYALLSRFMGRESVSWICIKSCFLLSNHRVWKSQNRFIPESKRQEGKKK